MDFNKILEGLSSTQLLELAARATQRASDLVQHEPSHELALAAGIRDKSYKTVRWGTVRDYEGEVIIAMENGNLWKAVGHGPTGDASYIEKNGFIEFIPLMIL